MDVDIDNLVRLRPYSRTHILQRFQEHCQSLAANGNAGYQREFEELSVTGKDLPCIAGELGANKEKNRYPFVLPYDHCRVKLSLLDSQPHSDYINASYVPGGCTEQDFICTQAPLPSTMADFWRMVWEQNVQVIVMLTSFKEGGKVMCNQYWPPERGTGCYGALQVTTVSRHHGPDSYITSIRLRHRGCPSERHITHYYYPGWPDQGVPKAHVSLCAFTEYVRKHLDNSPSFGPTVVHCSAGVGRSGTFVTLLWLMQLCVRGILPNVCLAVQDLRKHRVLMVQKLEQYMLVHQCLLHWLGGNINRQSTQTAVVHFQTTQPEKLRQSKRHCRSRSRNYPESAHLSHQVSHIPWPQHTPLSQHTPMSQNTPRFQHTPWPKHTPQPVHISRLQHTPQPQPQDTSLHQQSLLLKHTPQSEHTHRHENTPRSRHQPEETQQQTAWWTLQNSLHVIHPGKLLQRILPPSFRLSSFTSSSTTMGQ